MEVLTEIHDEAELAQRTGIACEIIGINNRDLKTLKVDLETTRRLAPRIPGDRITVCESGLSSRTDLDALAPLVDGFLVGSHLMKSQHVDLSTRELIFGRVKICGLKSPEQVRLAYTVGASFGGLIFAHESPRFVSDEQARHIAAGFPIAAGRCFRQRVDRANGRAGNTIASACSSVARRRNLAMIDRPAPRPSIRL